MRSKTFKKRLFSLLDFVLRQSVSNVTSTLDKANPIMQQGVQGVPVVYEANQSSNILDSIMGEARIVSQTTGGRLGITIRTGGTTAGKTLTVEPTVGSAAARCSKV